VQTVTGLSAAKPQDVRREEFKAKLKKAIADATPQPKTESEANAVMKQGGAKASETLKADLGTERKAAVGPMEAAAATEAPVSGQPAPPVTELHVQPPGPAPAGVSPASVVPAPLPAERLDYSADREPTDRAMAQSDVTQDQLKKGNDPAFTSTLDSRAEAEKHEATAEARYRGQERAVQGSAHAEAAAALAHGLGGIHAGRIAQLGKVGDRQQDLKSRDALKRQEITNRITGIKNNTKIQVDAILKQIDNEAPEIFGNGLARAEKAYDAAFEDAKGGIGTWLTTWGSDWDDLITSALATARTEYMRQVDIAIDQVADLVDTKLKEAKDCVAAGRAEVDQFVDGLDGHLRQAGEAARAAVSGDFDAMTAQIDEHRDALISKLAQQYKESYERMSAREEELREANKSLWQRVYDATVGLIKKIIAFKNMLVDVLARAAGVVSEIIHDPIGFLGNLVSAVMLGLKNFMANIGAHLEKGLMDWIFGALAGAGLKMPEAFDLKGIVSIILQVLGLTYANFRARAVAIVGEKLVAGLEQAAGVFKIVMSQGVSGLWEFIREKVSDLKSMVLDAIFGFVKEKVIVAGVTWIIGLLNPASAFFKACKAIYDIVMFFVEHGSEIVSLVNAVIDSVAAIVKGNLTAAAARVEDALAKAIPAAIGFLASLLGLGDPSKPVKETIEKAQSPVNKAIDWVITKAVALVKAAGKLLGFGKKEDKPSDTDPKHDAKVAAGLDDLANEEKQANPQGQSHAQAVAVAKKIRERHPVFTSLEAGGGELNWEFTWTASKGGKVGGALKSPLDAGAKESLLKLDQELSGAIAELKAYWESQDKEYEEYASTAVKDEGQVGSYGKYSEISLSDPANMEREHIIPRATMAALSSGYGFDIPADSPEYREQFALVVSKRTADIKTGRSSVKVEGTDPRYQSRSASGMKNLLSGDNRVSRKLKAFLARQAKAKEKKAVKLRQLFDAKVRLTIRARNEAGATAPTEAEIRGAALAQLESILQMVRDRYMAGQ
jgi:hypothetical protein